MSHISLMKAPMISKHTMPSINLPFFTGAEFEWTSASVTSSSHLSIDLDLASLACWSSIATKMTQRLHLSYATGSIQAGPTHIR